MSRSSRNSKKQWYCVGEFVDVSNAMEALCFLAPLRFSFAYQMRWAPGPKGWRILVVASINRLAAFWPEWCAFLGVDKPFPFAVEMPPPVLA
jgi:hypothetical protein